MLEWYDLVPCHRQVDVSLADQTNRHLPGDIPAEQIGRLLLGNDGRKPETFRGNNFAHFRPPGQPHALQLMGIGRIGWRMFKDDLPYEP